MKITVDTEGGKILREAELVAVPLWTGGQSSAFFEVQKCQKIGSRGRAGS